jgi:DNA-binding NarL/FixJ family response regulator
MMWNENRDFLRFGGESNVATSGRHQSLLLPISTKRRPEELTPREHEILQLVWAGLTNRIIAEQLHISVKTAEAHRANMMKKLRVSNIAQLLKTALEEGLLATHRG